MQNVNDQLKDQGTLGGQQATQPQTSGMDVGTEPISDTTNTAPTSGTGGGGGGGGDFLDKGVKYAEQELGHPQSASTTEKISDGIRSGFKKMTGKDIPFRDKQAE